MKKIIALVMALALVLASCAVAFADPVTHTISTTSDKHTYQIYQVFTGTYDSATQQLQDLKYGANAKTGTVGQSVSEADMAALDEIAKNDASGKYANDQARITALSAYVNLSGDPVATIGKDNAASATLPEGYYMIKDLDDSLRDPEGYTLYLFGTLSADQVITPKSSTTTVDKSVTETNDTTAVATAGQNGADYDQGDSIPYEIDITLAENVHDYKTYTVTLTDTLSDGLTPPAVEDVHIAFVKKDGTTAVDTTKFGTPTASVSGQVITVTYTVSGAEGAAIGANDLDGAKIIVTYNAELNDKAVVGDAGNPNTYTITYTNNPNGNDTGTTPEEDVFVYTYELNIVKVDGNNKPLEGAGFTLYKEVTENYTGAQTGADIKAGLATGVDASKLDDAKYYVAISMTENVKKTGDTVDEVKHSTDTTIDAGNYVLIETTVPAGYNAYAGENIVITSTIDADGKLTGLTATPATLTVAEDHSEVDGSVVNNSGTQLPSTGGIGTTIFYILGGLLVVGAVVILVARRKAQD